MKFNFILLIIGVLLVMDVTHANSDLKLHDSFKRELRRVVRTVRRAPSRSYNTYRAPVR